MITVHHLENSRSFRVVWLLESLGVDFKIKGYKRNPKTSLAPKELLKISPLGKSPVLQIDDVILPETGAIFEYVLAHFDKEHRFHPKVDDSSFKDYVFWLHFAEGSLMWPLVIKLIFSKTTEKVPFFLKPCSKLIFMAIKKAYLDHTLEKALEYTEKDLEQNEWFLGEEISAADFIMSFPLEAAVEGHTNMDSYPKIKAFVARVQARKDYQQALKRSKESLA
jgi:glutathione S-transferase